MKKKTRIYKEGKHFPAEDPVTNVADQGKTRKESLKNLRKGLHKHHIILVENAIKNSENSVMTMKELRKSLPKGFHKGTLKTIIDYLEENNKICESEKGITWVHNTNLRLRKDIERPEYIKKARKIMAEKPIKVDNVAGLRKRYSMD